jgi:hypothetical protein
MCKSKIISRHDFERGMAGYLGQISGSQKDPAPWSSIVKVVMGQVFF